MQSLEVISINIWQIIISLANLLLLFLIIKKFLFGPVQKMLHNRESALNKERTAIAEAKRQAEADQKTWEEKLRSAEKEADAILLSAAELAENKGEQIIINAKDKADSILRHAEEDAKLTRKKAKEGIKQEIVYVSTALAEKMLRREINARDHRALINSFIEEIGEDNGRNE